MVRKSLLPFVFLSLITILAEAQRMKVKRKGVIPFDVTKKTVDHTSVYSIGQFTGKWQEVSRRNSINSSVAFKDTLFYNFSDKGQVFSRDGVNMSLMGEAAIDPGNVLIAAADVFTIKSLNNNQLVLDDGEYIHTLVRKNNFWYETLPTTAIEQEKFTVSIPVNPSMLIGKWKVYRRDAHPGTTDKVLIRILNVQNIKNNNTATGEITFYQTEKLETLPCTITLNEGRMHIVNSKASWNVNVYKADANNFVFGDASLMYYCKPI